MRFVTTLAAATALTIAGVAANAGGIAPKVMEVPEVQPDPPATSSISSTYVIVGVLAALLIAAAVNANDDD